VSYSCDCCGAETSGYGKRDLLAEGWKWHDGRQGREIVVCGECAARHASHRAVSAAPEEDRP
jgi:hypothetical protein